MGKYWKGTAVPVKVRRWLELGLVLELELRFRFRVTIKYIGVVDEDKIH